MRSISINRRGQITLLVLLLGMLGLTVALAAASMSLQNINQTTQTDQGTQALTGAEAALQFGVANYNPSNGYLDCTDPASNYTDIGTGISDTASLGFSKLQYKICKEGSTAYGEYLSLPKDEVFQVNVPQTVTPGTSDKFNVGWKNNNSAVEVSVVYKNSTTNALSLRRFAVNGDGFTPNPANNFSASSPSPCANTCGQTSYGSTSSCYTAIPATDSNNSNAPAQFIRVRRLYSSGDAVVCLPGKDLQVSKLVVYGVAKTKSGAVRRVKADLSAPAMPAIFDYAIFTEGFLSK